MSEDNGINVLSLFDGMSCGQIALQRAGIKVNQYFASEIDKHAIKVTMANFPDTIQLGDVTKVSSKDLPKIDLLIGGSPCQGFSFAGKGLNFEDERSKLFFEFVRLKEECNPTYFLLENVQMKYEHELVISKYLNVNPIEINSALLSAQNRVRLYWTNINEKSYGLFGDRKPDIPQPKDKNILLKDILEIEVDNKFFLVGKAAEWAEKITTPPKEYTLIDFSHKNEGIRLYEGKSPTINQRDYKEPRCVAMRGRNIVNGVRKDVYGAPTEQRFEVNKNGKTNCLTAVQKDNLVMQLNKSIESNGSQPYQQNRVYHTSGISPALLSQMSCGSHAILVPEATKKGYVEVNPGECFDSENINSTTRRGRKMNDKSNCLMAKETDFMQYTSDFRIRRLTPTECERLQTVPDDYTKEASDTQRYRMLGNGWTVDVIVHILSFMK